MLLINDDDDDDDDDDDESCESQCRCASSYDLVCPSPFDDVTYQTQQPTSCLL